MLRQFMTDVDRLDAEFDNGGLFEAVQHAVQPHVVVVVTRFEGEDRVIEGMMEEYEGVNQKVVNYTEKALTKAAALLKENPKSRAKNFFVYSHKSECDTQSFI